MCSLRCERFLRFKSAAFLFLKAEVIKADLDKVIDYRSGPTRNEDIEEPPKAQPDIKYVWTLPDWRGQRTSNECARL